MPEQTCKQCGKPLELRQDEKGPNAADLANNGAHVDLCRGLPEQTPANNRLTVVGDDVWYRNRHSLQEGEGL